MNASGSAIQQILDGSGDGAGHTLVAPVGIAVDRSGRVFVADSANGYVFRVTPAGAVSELVSATAGVSASKPTGIHGLAVDRSGQTIYVSDPATSRIFKIVPAR